MSGSIIFSTARDISSEDVLGLYTALQWSAVKKPDLLHRALVESHSLVTARDGSRLVGLANAISDGHLVVYYPHLLVHPDYQRRGIGKRLMQLLMDRYEGFHQHMIVADGGAIGFYGKCGFVPAGRTQAMWIYAGNDH